MFNFNSFLETLREDLGNLAMDFGEDFKDDLVEAGSDLVNNTREDLERWTRQYAEGDLSKEDFKFLLKGRKDLAELEALKQKGLTQIRIDELKDAVVDTIIGSVRKGF